MLHILKFAARNLLRQRRRTLLALLTLCFGVTMFMLAGGFIQWIFENMRESTIHSQLGHVQITRPGYFREGLADPYSYLLDGDPSVVGADPAIPIRTATPRLSFGGLVSLGDATVSFVGEGIDPDKEAPISRAITTISGRNLIEGGSRSVVIGEGLAASLKTKPGDSVVLLATTAGGGINAVELEVAGIFASATQAYDDTVLRVPIDIARELMRVEGATSWVILLDRTAATDAAVTRLRAQLPADEFEIVAWHELADFYNKTVELFSRQVGVVRILIAFIIILSISNILTMTVIERTNEIGSSMAIGLKRRTILGTFVTEGALLGLTGGILGVAVGVALGDIISWIGIPMPPPPGMARGYIGQIAISPALALDAFLLAFVTTLLASVFPAWKASRMNIVDALRHQR